MIGTGIDADVFHFGADFQGGGSALHLEVFGKLDGVATLELVAMGVAEDGRFGLRRCFFGGPFVAAVRAGEERTVFVSVFGLALGAVWNLAHVETIQSASDEGGKGISRMREGELACSFLNDLQEFILEGESFDFALVGVFVGRSFDVLLDPVHLFVDIMIFIKEACEMGVVHLEVMNGVSMLWKFVEEVVFFNGHGIRVFLILGHRLPGRAGEDLRRTVFFLCMNCLIF